MRGGSKLVSYYFLTEEVTQARADGLPGGGANQDASSFTVGGAVNAGATLDVCRFSAMNVVGGATKE